MPSRFAAVMGFSAPGNQSGNGVATFDVNVG